MTGTCRCVGAVTAKLGHMKVAPQAASLCRAGKPTTAANLSGRDREA